MKITIHPEQVEMLLNLKRLEIYDRSFTSLVNKIIKDTHKEVMNERKENCKKPAKST